MKKSIAVTSLILVILICSCSTLNNKTEQSTFSDYEARFAMQTAMTEANRSSLNQFYTYLEKDEQFVPDKYQILIDEKDKVVGLSSILEDWRLSVVDNDLDVMNNMSQNMDIFLNQLDYPNPSDFVTSSNTSGSSAFSKKFKSDLASMFEQELGKLDISTLNMGVNYYNAMKKLEAFENGTSAVLLDDVQTEDFKSLADKLAQIYIELLSSNEEIFRTTPNLYVNSIVAKVFNLE